MPPAKRVSSDEERSTVGGSHACEQEERPAASRSDLQDRAWLQLLHEQEEVEQLGADLDRRDVERSGLYVERVVDRRFDVARSVPTYALRR